MAELNRLSCTRCKDRKVRCNRVMPRCDRCRAQDQECFYPERQKRRPNRNVVERPGGGSGNDTLLTILERLQRVEEYLPPGSTGGGDQGESPDYGSGSTPRTGSTHRPPLSNAVSAVPSPSTSIMGDWASMAPRGLWPSMTALNSKPLDATAILKDAMDQVQKMRLATYSASVVTDEINIPPELAKRWIRDYFAQKPTDMFLSLLDKNFMEMIPDILRFPHIHIDSCVIIIYYGVLWRGCSIFASNDCSAQATKWTKLTYLGCLRAIPGWQREATGTVTDMIAAITMARVSGECFDYEMAWKMFRLAGEYAQGLGVHNLDGEGGMMSGLHKPGLRDNDRKSWWDLIQVDCFFRLIFNKPPSISGDAWKVNLPWLDPASEPPEEGDVALTFIVSSRLTLLVIQFFAMLEEEKGVAVAGGGTKQMDVRRMMARTESMCAEIKSLYDEWKLTEWAKSKEVNELDTWTVAEVTMNGYTSILFMLRKMAALERDANSSNSNDIGTSSSSSSPQPITTDADVPDSPIALDAARHLVDIMGWLLAKYPDPSTLASTFGAYRAYVPFAYLVSHILRSIDGEQHQQHQHRQHANRDGSADAEADASAGGGGRRREEAVAEAYSGDIESLERAGRCVSEIARSERDFVPLARAIEGLNGELRVRLG